MKRHIVLCACAIVASGPLHATEIYRWVDESGHTHVSDVVPEQYKRSATKLSSRQYEPTSEQRREAQARATKDKAMVDELMQRRALAEASASASAASAAAGVRSMPRAAVDDTTDCATRHRLYRESNECFAPYKQGSFNGPFTRPEGFEKCGPPVPDPSYKCGPAKPQ